MAAPALAATAAASNVTDVTAATAGTLPPELSRPVAAALELVRTSAAALAPAGARVEAQAGALDPRLRLAPCREVQSYLPAGAPAWGRTRVALRCMDGAARWNVFLPVTVSVWAPALQLRAALPAGARIAESQLASAEVDWAAGPTPPLADPAALADRVLARPVAAGQALRQGDLQPRRWFALGDTVRIVAAGTGFRISAEGQALTPGLEGQPARVRTENGRVLTGRPVGERRLEVAL
ncbi:MAG: flagellar basal body P-ring formation protein FlgA [Rubrivivax sp.]|nr:flagellar basal body P-ring formation protein FlgA [Rubrivivax sp.]